MKFHFLGPICSQLSTPDKVTTSNVSLVIHVRGSLTISLQTAVSRVALQLGSHGSTLPGSAAITMTNSSLASVVSAGAAAA